MSATVQSVCKIKMMVAWTLQILLAVVFAGAGTAKLAGVPMMVGIFAQIGLGQWFRIIIGLGEVGGAIMLLFSGSASLGAAGLGLTMFCAIVVHIGILDTDPAPAIFLFLLTTILLWLRLDPTEEPEPRLF